MIERISLFLTRLIWSWHEQRRSKWLEEDPEHRMNAWEYSQWAREQNRKNNKNPRKNH